MDKEAIIKQLNRYLLDADSEWEQVMDLIRQLTEGKGLKAKVLDFEFYSDERLEHAEREKYQATRRQCYEEAAIWRDKTNEIQQHVDLRNDLQLSSSAFQIEHGHLFFFHTGDGPHDQKVMELLRE